MSVSERPRWATLHPDNWSVLEVTEWIASVVDEYALGQEVKVSLVSCFQDVNGQRLSAMTLQDFSDLDPAHGSLLFTVFRAVMSGGRLDSAEHPDDQPRTLTPIREVEGRVTRHAKQDQAPDEPRGYPPSTNREDESRGTARETTPGRGRESREKSQKDS
ncbi:hypothetical protein BaRGS_00027264 [Batillaria attramentaria]|uniref:PNT domain-containing protein n=1 Tax=Batillaria attramentaria TaxID=370345 RepID=A0ABD0K3W9_9CAEN